MNNSMEIFSLNLSCKDKKIGCGKKKWDETASVQTSNQPV